MINRNFSKFETFLKKKFELGSLEADNFEIMGAKLTQIPSGSIKMNAKDKLSAMNPTMASASQKGDRPATATKIADYQSVFGRLLCNGRLPRPVISFKASDAATKYGNLQLHHITALETALNSARITSAVINFQLQQSEPLHLEIVSDASMQQLHDKKRSRRHHRVQSQRHSG